jgi:hypothetical protein
VSTSARARAVVAGLPVADPGRRHAHIEVPIPCAACGAASLQPPLHVHDQKHAKPRWDYHVVRCAACGFLYRHPGIRPERLGELYATGKYAQFLAGRYTRKRVQRYEVTMAPFGALFAAGEGRRLLDFGCGNGLFLDLAYERGFECYGVDLAADAIEAARQKPSGRCAYGEPIELGSSPLSPRAQRRLRRTVDRGNRGNMLRAAAFADPDGPRRWGLAAISGARSARRSARPGRDR